MLTTVPFLAISLVAFFADVALSQKCTGQSCYVASLSGSTENPYKIEGGRKPTGGNAMGDTCIKNWYKKLGLPAPPGLKKYADLSPEEAYKYLVSDMKEERQIRRAARGEVGRRPPAIDVADEPTSVVDSLQTSELETSELQTSELQASELQSSEVELEKRQGTCTPYILLYARGTTESGDLGMTVGPSLAAGLRGDKNWSVRGINSRDGYAADLGGIYCIGMTGGMACKDILNKMSAQCPNSKFVTSGYSQGAMVARICVAFADESARAKVAGILTYGDPFNGATVKGFPSDKIKINCNPTDGVCKGDFAIGAGHLSYSTASGVAWLKQLASKG